MKLGVICLCLLIFVPTANAQLKCPHDPSYECARKNKIQEEQREQRGAKKNKDCPPIDRSIIQKQLQAPHEKEAANSNGSHRLEPGSQYGWQDILSKPAAAFTGILAILTFFLVIAGFAQVIISRNSSERQLRAYALLQEIGQATVPNASGTGSPEAWRFEAIWKNYGSTPTARSRIYANYLVSPVALDMRTVKWESLDTRGEMVRHPGGEFIPALAPTATARTHAGQFSLGLLERTREDLQNPTAFIYLWGWIDYDDIFKGAFRRRARHRHEFFGRLLSIGPASATNPDRYAFRIMGPHNGTEEECARKPRPYKAASDAEERT
jgi:hypothetical protein